MPQISIEIDGIQLQARLLEISAEATAVSSTQDPQAAISSTPSRPVVPPNTAVTSNATANDDGYLPTVDGLAESFLRTEPADEIRELEHELESRSPYLQESMVSSDDGDDESSAGMATPLALPTYLRSILNTALDRLSIVINNIDIEMEDELSPQSPDTSKPAQVSPTTINFHIERIAVDTITRQGVGVDVGSSGSQRDADLELGKRKMRIDNICARLVSDVDTFVSLSRFSRPPSPETTRSEVSLARQVVDEPSLSHTSLQSEEGEESSAEVPQVTHVSSPVNSPLQASNASVREVAEIQMNASSSNETEMSSSVHTVDDDRFEDATSDDESTRGADNTGVTQSRYSLPPQDLGGSSVLYDDEGILDYAMQNSILDSQFDDAPALQVSAEGPISWNRNGLSSSQRSQVSEIDSDGSASALPTVSALGRSFQPPVATDSPSQSTYSEQRPPTHDLFAEHGIVAEQTAPTTASSHPSSSASSSYNSLAQSQFFTHDDAESMYMSAVSATGTGSTHSQHVPGGWGTSPTSSRQSASDESQSIPDEMISGSILEPLSEVDDGYQTPRPSSRQTSASSPHIAQAQTATLHTPMAKKQAKLLLTIDEITLWFPLGLNMEPLETVAESDTTETPSMDFKPPNLGEDSIFAEMPGSFSNYAHSSSHRRTTSVEESSRRPPFPKASRRERPTERAQNVSAASISMDVGSVAVHMDVSTGRILFAMFHRVIEALTDDRRQPSSSKARDPPRKIGKNILEVSVKHVGVAWMESIFSEPLLELQSRSRPLDLAPGGAILRLSLSGIRLTTYTEETGARAKLQIGGFVLASLDQDIISFNGSRPRANRSVSTLPEQLRHDIEIDYEQAKDQRITVVTRPVKVMFDVQKLDDALSSFGGFSGVLELSSSISSNNAVHSPEVSITQPRPRGVHFGDGVEPPTKAPPRIAGVPKFQFQFGEVTFTLKGRTCAVQVQTTSIRVAVRESNVRLKVSEVQLLGPYVAAGQTGTPLVVDIRGTTLNFLFAPEEIDLARLISMITPSKNPYENNDDILIDTLLRQRRKGSVLRAEIGEVRLRVSDLEQMKTFEALGAELARLSKVAKYLPDDDRPGLLTLTSMKRFDARVAVGEKLGEISISLYDAALAHVGVPALLAAEIGKATVARGSEVLIHEVVNLRPQDRLPAIMIRMVGDEMEPIAKAKLFNVCSEYHVSTIMAALGIPEAGTADDIALGIASSVATITGSSPQTLSRQSSQASSPPASTAKPLQIDLLLRNCAVGLNPRKVTSKGLFVLTEAHLAGKQVKADYSLMLELRKASMHAIDDIARLEEEHEPSASPGTATAHYHLQELSKLGFVSLSSMSAAKIYVNIAGEGKDKPQLVDVEFKNDLFVLESCADSTQTLIAILNGLQPPLPPSTAEKYRTVVPLQEMMESFTGDAFLPDEDATEDDFMRNADLVEDEVPTNLEFVGSFYNSQSLPTDEEMGDSLLDEDDLGALAKQSITRQRGDPVLLESFQEKYEITETEQDFDFSEQYFQDSEVERKGKGKAKKWDSTKNQYHLSNEFKAPDAPLKVRVRDVNIIWNLYDGYDWPRTRSIISQAVDDVEARAEERRRQSQDDDEDDDFVEEDFLFNSVWIGVPVKDEKGALARRINHDIDDLASETGSYATSTATRSTGATAGPRSSAKSRRRLKLERSKHKKVAFSIMGLAVDLIVFPPGTGETISSIDVRIRDLEVFDHVPTSTWKKFVTCAIDPSVRELNRPMINLELVTVKPVTDLAASELVIKVTVDSPH